MDNWKERYNKARQMGANPLRTDMGFYLTHSTNSIVLQLAIAIMAHSILLIAMILFSIGLARLSYHLAWGTLRRVETNFNLPKYEYNIGLALKLARWVVAIYLIITMM